MLTVILATLGILNALYLYWQHSQVPKGRKIFCLIGGDCQTVVESKYGRTFGVKNELWGTAYYLVIIILSQYPNILISALSLLAAIFSLYLLFLQSYILKKYCSWCLLAIALNLTIFASHLLQPPGWN